ncbi:MAG: cyclic peptide export ABC transporter [Alphaproteobacteria bacterium]|nr:cyclic peptide export ABC transporter [Alphaproteobacteria bacterium]
MDLIRLILGGLTGSKRRLLLMVVSAGVSNAAVIAIIATAAAKHGKSDGNTFLVLLFVVVIVAYMLSQRFIMVAASGEVEGILHRIRLRVIDKLLRCELRDVEAIGLSTLQAGLGKDTQTISQFATPMVLAAQAAVLVICALSYIAWLSFITFVLAVVFLSGALVLYFRRLEHVTTDLQTAMLRERELSDTLTDMLAGFKEIKMNSRRSAAIQDDGKGLSGKAAALRVMAQSAMARNFVFAQVSLFLLLAIGVFIVPLFSSTSSSVVSKATMAVLFLIGPISGLVALVPVFVDADAAARDITALERRLDALLGETGQGGSRPGSVPLLLSGRPMPQPFREIVFEDVVFRHIDREGNSQFSIGPVNLTIRAGDITFITGGNGSGKSTLLKLLTGLYRPDRGRILVDGVVIEKANLQAFRDMFSTVFSDYHLFRLFYGVPTIGTEEGARLIEEFELSAKTAIEIDHFRTSELSGGQRRRLALLVAMMERRPICVLDEWAADQDPHFRKKFYREILPAMKAKGTTVIAVTHDDRYFDACDSHVRMDEGRVIEVSAGHEHA